MEEKNITCCEHNNSVPPLIAHHYAPVQTPTISRGSQLGRDSKATPACLDAFSFKNQLSLPNQWRCQCCQHFSICISPSLLLSKFLPNLPCTCFFAVVCWEIPEFQFLECFYCFQFYIFRYPLTLIYNAFFFPSHQLLTSQVFIAKRE